MKRKVACFGIFIALSLIFSYIESLIPIPLGVPGIKLGLSNLLIVFVLYKMGAKEAIILSIMRVLLSGLIFGNLFSILYSLVGAIFSFVAMFTLKKFMSFSVIGISMAGGVAHNVGQLLVASIILESKSIFYYAPILMISGIIAGVVIGILCNEMIKRLSVF